MPGFLRVCCTGLFALTAPVLLGQAPPALTVQGIHGTAAKLPAADFARLPQHTIQTSDHGKPATFGGVRLADLLSKVSVPAGEAYHSTAASYSLVAEGRDGYRAAFAWAELDPTFMDKDIYVANRRDGKPLPEKDGPFQLVAPGEKRGARWVRQLSVLRIVPLPSAHDDEYARWILANLPELTSVRAGMTRKELLKVFTEEGGISSRQWQRYTYRKCQFVHVEVEFAPVGGPGAATGPDDRITKISKPFLEPSIRD